MKQLVAVLLVQEIGLGAVFIAVGVSFGFIDGFEVGVRVTLYLLLLLQLIIVYTNYKVIKKIFLLALKKKGFKENQRL